MPPAPPRFLVLTYRFVLIVLALGYVKGAFAILGGQLAALLPRLAGWQRALPVVGWGAGVVAIGALWRWRWWGLGLSLATAAFELGVELAGGGLGWHLLRIPTAALLVVAVCLPLRESFRRSSPERGAAGGAVPREPPSS